MKSLRIALAALLLLSAAAIDARAGASWETTATLTRPANATTYTAATTVCAAAACAALPLGTGGSGPGQVAAVQLIKSSNGATGNSFTVHLFKAVPTLPATDDLNYPAPYNVDRTNYIGNAACTTGVVGADNATFYQCTLSQNLLPYAGAAGVLYAQIEAVGAYVPVSGEVFTLRVTGFND